MLERTSWIECERLAFVDPLKIVINVNEPVEGIRQYVSLLKEYVISALIEDSKTGTGSASEISQPGRTVPISVTGKNNEVLSLTYPENQAPRFKPIKRLYKIFRRLAEIGNAYAELPEDARLEDIFTSHDSQFSIFTTPNNTYVQFSRNNEDARTYGLYMRILEVACVPFIHKDPFQLELKEEVKKGFVSDITDILRSQYASLLDEYATQAILAEEPESERSTMAGSRSSSQLIRSPNLWAMSYGDKWIEQLTLEYNEEKIPLVRRLHQLYGIFVSLAAGNYAPAEIPKGARLADVFTSHHSQLFLFETETPKGTYIHLKKDAEQFENFKNTESVAYQITG